MAEREFLTVKDIMQKMGISKNTAYKLIHEKGLKASRVGNMVMVREADFEAWLAENRVGGEKG